MNIPHELYEHRLYNTWRTMNYRIYTHDATRHLYYNKDCIIVDLIWQNQPTQFINDMYPSFKEGLILDRIDINSGYSKNNCYWATPAQHTKAQEDYVYLKNTSLFEEVKYIINELQENNLSYEVTSKQKAVLCNWIDSLKRK